MSVVSGEHIVYGIKARNIAFIMSTFRRFFEAHENLITFYYTRKPSRSTLLYT